MKRTVVIMTVLAVLASVTLGVIIGRLSGGSDGETLPATSGRRGIIGTPLATAEPTGTTMRSGVTPATPGSASTPSLSATPHREASPDPAGSPTAGATPTGRAAPAEPSPTVTPRSTMPSDEAVSAPRSLGEVRQAPTVTPTLVPNPPPLATVTPTMVPPPDDGTSITIRII